MILKPRALIHVDMVHGLTEKSIKGRIKLDNNYACNFRGIYDPHKKNLASSNLPTINYSKIKLEISNADEFRETMLLTMQENIPVILEIE